MTRGDGGLEIDLERKGVEPDPPKKSKPKKERDWKAIGMTAGKFLSGLAVSLVAAWGALKPETEAEKAAENAKSAYAVSQEGIENISKDLAETKAALSVLTKRFSDHTESYHNLDKRLIRVETILEMEEFEGEDSVTDEQLAMLAELDAIRRELEESPPVRPPPEPVKTKGHGKPKPAPPPHIRHEGQQIKLPDAEELFR